MANVINFVESSHPLVGVWMGNDDDARAEYTISTSAGRFHVSAIDAVDGEGFEISDVRWDPDQGVLSFRSLMPSTGREGKTAFRLISRNRIAVDFTFTEHSTWVRKE